MNKHDQIIQSHQEKILRKHLGYDVESDDDDELLELLEEDMEYDQYRERRLEELSKELKATKKSIDEGHGSVETLLNEDQVFQTTTRTTNIVLHFFHPDFAKCKIMDSKLETLAQKDLTTKFIRINVENAPFLVTRLKIKVLPVVLLYINGIEVNRVVGFDKLNYKDDGDFPIETLEKFLLDNGVIIRRANNYERLSRKSEEEDNESDLDL